MITTRQLKVAEQLRELLAEFLIKEDLYDKTIPQTRVMITGVRVSPDLAYAKVYTHMLGEENKDVIDALNAKKYLFRKYIAKNMQLRIVPDLIFMWDDTFEQAKKVDALFDDPKVKADLNTKLLND